MKLYEVGLDFVSNNHNLFAIMAKKKFKKNFKKGYSVIDFKTTSPNAWSKSVRVLERSAD